MRTGSAGRERGGAPAAGDARVGRRGGLLGRGVRGLHRVQQLLGGLPPALPRADCGPVRGALGHAQHARRYERGRLLRAQISHL